MEAESKIKEERIDDDEDGSQCPRSIFPFKVPPSAVDFVDYREFSFKFVRPISCNTGELSNPHGSVKLFQGDTCVMAAVYGPTEVRISKELPHRGAVDVLYRPKVTGMSQLSAPVMDPVIEERNMEQVLSSIFEKSIYLEDIVGLGYNIIIHEFENDGCLLSASINATTIALLDGGCSLRHTVAGVTMILTKDKKLIVDPSSRQLSQGYDVKFTYAFSNEIEVLYANVQGHATPQVLKVAQAHARSAAEELFQFFYFLALKKNRMDTTLRNGNSIQMDVNENGPASPEDGEIMSD